MDKGKTAGDCSSCKEKNEVDDMVACDKCSAWFHFKCAGVDESVKDCKWICAKCQGGRGSVQVTPTQGSVSTQEQTHDSRSTVVPTSQKSRSSNKSRQLLQLELQLLEEEKELNTKLLEEKEQKQREYLHKKFELLKVKAQSDDNGSGYGGTMAGSKAALNDVFGARDRTESWVAKTKGEFQSEEMRGALTQDQMASRKSLSRDLPVFTGKSEEWPVFISCYRNSTKLCNYSNEENLIRLQKALKGKAYEAVSSQLLLPSSVFNVISTLEMLFGRPEHIIEDLITKAENFPNPKSERLETLISYALAVRNLSATMEASDLTDHINNPVLLRRLVDKLPPTMKMEWAMDVSTGTVVRNLVGFGDWMHTRAEAAAAVTRYSDEGHKSVRRTGHIHAHTQEDNKKENSSPKEVNSAMSCYMCNGRHRLVDCDSFHKLSVRERTQLVEKKELCLSCMKHSKRVNCRYAKKCDIAQCKQRHHRLLHDGGEHSVASCHSHRNEKEAGPLFRILPVVLHANGKNVHTYAFLDSGSSLTLLEDSISKQLDLVGTPKPLCLRWTANSSRREDDSKIVSLTISSDGPEKEKFPILQLNNVRTVKSLALPSQSLSPAFLKKFSHLRDLPLSPYERAECGILIGLDNEKAAIPLKVREGKWNAPLAIKTRLGWCVSGGNEQNLGSHANLQICECEEDLHELVKQHFILEDSGVSSVRTSTSEDKRAREILESTTKRINGAYECGLLWRQDEFSFPNSFSMALRRLCCLEKKMQSNPDVVSNINQQVLNLVQKGYASKCNTNQYKMNSPKTWYLPTFIVTNPNKPGKLRLVWDAAAKVSGVSLNKMLLKGPDQLNELPVVLFGFRTNKVAITGDIEEMFHQVRVRKEDQCAQRFLWRNGEVDRDPDVYQMEVLTFGASCSPSIALYVKDTNASEFVNLYPRAVQSILEHHYMDDMLDSVATVEEAVQLAREVSEIHSKAGFKIRDWMSNSEEVVSAFNQTKIDEKQRVDFDNENNIAKVLGLWWRPSDDVFTFSLRFLKTQNEVLTGYRVPTKRELLKTLMSIFDPLGFLAFYLVRIKVLLQDVWRQKIDWDDCINGSLVGKWESWRKLLPQVKEVCVPRCYTSLELDDGTSVQLHIFVDASEDAFAAVAYFRFSNSHGTECALVESKSKVSPLLPVSIPRLELQAALIGARLAKRIAKGHKFKIDRHFYWTDSKTVLQWLRSDAKMYKPFVMFRIGEIQEKTKLDEWRWVPTALNVADEATKWTTEPSFEKSNRWFSAPKFLWQQEMNWPVEGSNINKVDCEEELRAKYVLVMQEGTTSRMEKGILSVVVDFDRYSTWEHLRRIVAYIIRYCQNLLNRTRMQGLQSSTGSKHQNLSSNPIQSEELRKAEVVLWKMSQWSEFADELLMLRKGTQIPKSNKLYKLNPYIDEDGILRLEGRIDYADFVEEDTRRPIILSRKSRVSFLIVDYYHRLFKHHCDATVYNEVRQQYYIPALRALVRAVRIKCAYCCVKNAKPRIPLMAQLPPARLGAFRRPFTYIGIVYFGPMLVVQGRSQVKRWGVLFTCLTTRAIHVEVAFSLNTDSCILSIQRFIARRGLPSEIYSDNGTNFVGAEKELRDQFQLVNKEKLARKFISPQTKWFFNPPAAPHMGGSWERLIGTVKKILKDVLVNRRMNDEALHSSLVEIEAVVNSRPLTYVTLGHRDEEALTPNHFILGSSSGYKGLVEDNDRELLSRKDWRKAQQVANLFWKRWVREYLPTLTRRTKWFEKAEKLKIGDVVIIIDENLPRSTWPKGIVINTVESKDGQVRRATVRTADGCFERPTARLAVLDISCENNNKADGAPLLGGGIVTDGMKPHL